MDFLKLPDIELNGKTYNQLFVIVDRFSKYVYLVPQNIWYDTTDVARDFYNTIFVNEGLPLEIISDRDAKFTSKFWQCLLEYLHIKPVMSTAFHPQTDGQTEKRNKDAINVLRAFLIERGEKWIDVVGDAQAALNFRVDSTTNMSPFEICRGYKPRTIPYPKDWNLSVPAVTDLMAERQTYYLAVQEKLANARNAQAVQANKHRRIAPKYKEGQQVMLSSKNIRSNDEQGKLMPRWLGPFPVTKTYHDTDNYSLKLPQQYSRLHNKFHTSLLKPFIRNNNVLFPNRQHAKPSATFIPEVEADNLFEVDHIRDRKIAKNGDRTYLIRWQGYGPADDSWEPQSNIPEQLTDYYDLKNPSPLARTTQKRNRRTRNTRPTKKEREGCKPPKFAAH